MSFAKTLNRDEMKNVMAGYAECGIACNNFASDCIGGCENEFSPHQDMWTYCIDTCETQTDYCLQGCYS